MTRSLVRQPLLATSIALALAGCGIAHAGTVDVKYVQDGQYTDAGRGRDLEQVEWSLTQHLQQLGAKSLPARQTLSIEVLDIDLAGELRPWHRVWPDARVMRGSTDWPRIKLHYTLREGEQVLSTGEEQVADMAYLTGGRSWGLHEGQSLYHEKRMLSEWFARRFTGRP
jgi:hypothetical protein